MIIARAKQNLELFQNRYWRPIVLKKGEPYIMAEGLFMQVKNKMKKDVFKKFEKYYKPIPKGRNIKDGDKLLVWRTGGIGDILFITTILNHIKKKFPNTIIKFGCGKQYQDMIEELPFIDKIVDLPLHLSHLQMCDYSIIFENVIENNPLAEKINCYDLMASQFNIDFKDVDRKYPIVNIKEESTTILNKWLDENNLNDKKLILIHQRASSPIRTPTVHFSSAMVKYLVNALPDYRFLIVDMSAKAEVVDNYMKTHLKGLNGKVINVAHILKELSITAALVKRASCIVGIDSSLLHFAAAFETPAVGLYGPFKSDLRIKYYPRCIGIDAKWHCAPCFQHGYKHCEESLKINNGIGAPCFDAITYEEITDAVTNLLRKYDE